MNIKDLPQGSYKVVGADKINVKDLPAGSYKQVSGQAPVKPEPQKSFRFEVKPAVTLPSNVKKKSQQELQAEADAAKQEADKNSGFWGTLKNTVKAVPSSTKKVGKFLTSAEQGFGESIAKGLDNTTVETAAVNIEGLSKQNTMLLKTIKANEAAGKDSSALKREYNKNADLIEQNGGSIQEFSDSLPSGKQLAGQAAQVGLDVLTAGTYGAGAKGAKSFQLLSKTVPKATKTLTTISPAVTKVAEIASKPSGILTKQGVKNVAKGAGVGYGYDVSMNLQDDAEGTDILKPGAGTVIGAALPAVAEVRQSFKNKGSLPPSTRKVDKIIAKRESELSILESKYNNVRKVVEKAKNKGIEVKRILASTDLLNGAVDDTGHINTQNAMAELDDFIRPQESVISKNLAIEGKKISLEKVRAKLTRAIDDSGLEMGSLTRSLKEVDDDLAGLARRADADGNIAIAKLHEAKVDKYSNINYLNPESKKAGKVIAKALKELVEDNTDSVDVKALNKELSAHYAVLDLLEKLQGKKVEGGKLGKYFAQTVGAIVGSHFGPLGSIVGAELGGRIKGHTMSRTLNGKTSKVLEQSPAMKKAIENTDGYLNSLGSRNISQNSTINPTSNVYIPESIAQDGNKVKSLPKYKGSPDNAIKINYADNPNNPEFIPKAKIKAKVAEMKSAKPSSYIKVNNFDTPEFPKYIPRDNKRMMLALESKKNAGKEIDVVKNAIKRKLVRMGDIKPPKTNIQYVPIVEKKIKVNLPKKKKK